MMMMMMITSESKRIWQKEVSLCLSSYPVWWQKLLMVIVVPSKAKLLEIKPTLIEWKQSYRKKNKRKDEVILSRLSIGHTRTTHSYLKQSSYQRVMHARPNTLWNTFSLNVSTFYGTNMNELFQNNEIKECNVIPKSDRYIRKNLKEISTRPIFSYKLFLYKIYFNKTWSLPQTVPLPKNLFLLQDDSLQINFQ